MRVEETPEAQRDAAVLKARRGHRPQLSANELVAHPAFGHEQQLVGGGDRGGNSGHGHNAAPHSRTAQAPLEQDRGFLCQ
jgi:hypothetical protein